MTSLGGSQQYTVQFKNNSTNDFDFCVYQTNPGVSANVYPLAWFVQPVNPGTMASFTWSIGYGFSWSNTGLLQHGVLFNDNQKVPADLSTTNEVTLSYNGNFYFQNQQPGPSGSLTIVQDNSIPLNQASVGITMGGNSAYAFQAEPNLTYTFTPNPTYWCVFGQSYQTAQVLETEQISDPVQISFPAGVYQMYAVINDQNVLTVSQTPPANS